MALFNIGNFIKQRREELGITQGDLADELCSMPTLSRIENGSHVPNGNTLRALLQRLGYSDTLMLLPASREEFEITRLQVKIRQLYNTRDREGARELLAKLGEYKDFFSASNRQFYEVMRTVFYNKDFTRKKIPASAEVIYKIGGEYIIKNQGEYIRAAIDELFKAEG